MSLILSNHTIFVVTTDSNIPKKIKSVFPENFQFSTFLDWEMCFENMSQKPRVIFIEMVDDSNWGFSFLDKMNNFDKRIPIIVIQKNNNNTSAEFLQKPNLLHFFNKDEFIKNDLVFLVKNIERILQLQTHLKNAQTLNNSIFLKNMVTNSVPMQKVIQLTDKAAKSNINCYISGEKGTGKAAIANFIHISSNRNAAPFIHCNISSIQEEEIEKELFGIENRDSQTVRKGKIELATNGTLYLEDVDLLPLDVQVNFLNMLQSKSFTRVNGECQVHLNIRLIVSVKNSLFEEMNAGNFLESLYYLLMGLPIPMPPLRERGSDILILANKFITQFSHKNKIEKKKLTNKAKKKILNYFFPGNIIELKSTIDRAMVLAESDQINDEDIEFLNPSNQLHFLDSDMTFEEYKSKIIHHYLERYDGDIMKVSNKLDIGKSTIYRMLKSEKEKGRKRMNWLNLF